MPQPIAVPTVTTQWSPPFSTPVLLGLAVAMGLAWLVLRRASGRALPRAGHRGLLALRGAALVLLALILLNPVRVRETPGAVERPRVAYLVDASRSMALGEAGRTRWERSIAAIRDAEAARPAGSPAPEVDAFRFGSRLEALDPSAWAKPGEGPPPAEPAPAPTDADTLLAGSLETLSGRIGADPPRAVVVFSDGRARDPDRAPAIARGFGKMAIPIHVVPAGDSKVGGDVAIVSMVAPKLVRRSTRVPVQVFLRSFGYGGRDAEVKLVAEGADGRPGRVLARAPVALRDGLTPVALTFAAGDEDRRVVATVDPQPGEVAVDNNRFAADIAIDHTKIRVLYVEGTEERYAAPSRTMIAQGQPDEVQGAFTPLRRALAEDPDIECAAMVRLNGPGDGFRRSDDRYRGLPETPSELFAFDVLILSNLPAQALGENFLGWVDEWIARRGGGLCMVGGPNAFAAGRWGDTPIGRMLPVEVGPPAPDWDPAPAPIRPEAGTPVHPLWQIVADDAQNRQILQNFPEIPGRNRLGPPKATAEVLARAGSGSNPAAAPPALAVQPFGRGRTMALAGGISRSLAPGFAGWGQGGDNRYYGKFWRNAVYWLSENSSIGRRRLLAEADKRLYRPGEPITLRARAFNENAAPTLDYRVAVSVEPMSAADATADQSPLRHPSAPADPRGPLLAWGDEFELTRQKDDQSYRATLPIADGKSVPPGVSLSLGLRIELTAYEGNTQVDSTAVEVQILDDPGEQQNPLPDHDLLRRIARASGGSVLPDAPALARMLAALPASVGPPEIRTAPAWDRWWLLAPLLALLVVDWAWRRRLGLA